jgi:hypothetical protein
MIVVVMVPAARERIDVDSAITEHAHILQAVGAVPLGIMVLYMEIEVVVKCCIVCAAGATRLSAPSEGILRWVFQRVCPWIVGSGFVETGARSQQLSGTLSRPPVLHLRSPRIHYLSNGTNRGF